MWLNVYHRLHSASFQVNITFSLDRRGEDILKAANVYHRTPRENRSNGKIMLFTSHQSLFGWLCDYEWVVGCALTLFSCVFVSHYRGGRVGGGGVCSFWKQQDKGSNFMPSNTLMDSWSLVKKKMYQSQEMQTINLFFFSTHSFPRSNLLVQLYCPWTPHIFRKHPPGDAKIKLFLTCFSFIALVMIVIMFFE